MKGSDLLSLGIGAVVVYILYQWMQGAKAASGAVTNTLQQSSSSQVIGPPALVPNPTPIDTTPTVLTGYLYSGGGSASGGLLQP